MFGQMRDCKTCPRHLVKGYRGYGKTPVSWSQQNRESQISAKLSKNNRRDRPWPLLPLTHLKLKTAGIPQEQAEAVVRVIAEAQDGLVTKHDLTEAKNEIKAEMNVRFERIDGELKLNRWMLGVLLAGVISLVLKAFF